MMGKMRGFGGAVLCLLILSCLLSLPAAAQDPGGLPAGVRRVLEDPLYRHARWGFVFKDLATGKVLHALNEGTFFRPASVAKLFGAAAALDRLGSAFRVVTTVYRRGEVDAAGRLQGDLILVGGGDPFLGHGRASSLEDLARQVRAAGIRKVLGDVLVDDRAFSAYEAFSVSDPGRLLYRVSPAMVLDNLVEVTIKPTREGEGAAMTWYPHTSYLRPGAPCRTVASGPVRLSVSIDHEGRINGQGGIPRGGEPLFMRVPVSDGSSFVRSLFMDALRRQGVTPPSRVGRLNRPRLLPPVNEYRRLTAVAVRPSPPLGEWVRRILKDSHNPGADLLPLVMAVSAGKGSFPEGMALVKETVNRAGMDPRCVSLGDVSGLSTADLVTPLCVVSLLEFMKGHREYGVFRDSLPVLGEDGTLRGRGENSPARGKVSAKTGTVGLFDLLNDSGIVHVKGLAGYLTTAAGRETAFALFVNDVHVTDAPDRPGMRRLMDKVLDDLVGIVTAVYLAD